MLESIVKKEDVKMSKWKAFTLTELLIVTVIIGTLTVVALPNFLDVQRRSKVARESANQYALSTALESYQTDWKKYPYAAIPLGFPDGGKTLSPRIRRLSLLSTPIKYINEIPIDTFNPAEDPSDKVTNYLDEESYEKSGKFANDRPSVRGVDIEFFTRGSARWMLMS